MTVIDGKASGRWTAADIPDQSGRTAVVTGASGGLGRQTAQVLAGRGATVVLACGRRISRVLSIVQGRSAGMSSRGVLIGQFFLSVYGGYFGGAVGIMMLALWSIGLGLDAADSNPMRIAQLAAIYLSATVLFLVASDALRAPLLLTVTLVGAVAGGFAGAHLARRLPAWLLRGVILTTAVIMTVLYFLRG